MPQVTRAALAFIVLAATRIASADGPPLADQKFDAAQQLRDAGKIAEACALFRESLQLNPNAIGTLLNVARCDEEQGKVASAIRGFTDARDRASEQHLGPQRDAADEHLRALVVRVPHLALVFAVPPSPETRITVDDVAIDPASAADVLVDPGSVRVVVSAPGRVAFETHVAIAEREHHTQTIPALALPVVLKNPRQLVGKIVAFVGAGAVVAGVGLGVGARIAWGDNTSAAHCTPHDGVLTCNGDYSNRANSDRTLGNIATGIVVGGLVTAAVGASIWYFSPGRAERRVAIVPALGPGQAGLVAAGSF